MRSSILGLTLMFAFSATAAEVEKTVAQKEEWAARARLLEEKSAAVNSACGGKLTAAFDKASFPEFDPLKDRTTAPCRDVLNTLATLCGSPAGKQGVAKVTTVSCRYSTTGTAVKVNGSTLEVNIDPKQGSITGLKKGSYSWKSALEEVL